MLINAFEILGASPTDNLEKLQELLEEKELLTDDTIDFQTVFVELTNPQKRLCHEIVYLNSNIFSDFIKLISNENETISENKLVKILIDIGHWFDSNHDELRNKINSERAQSGFSYVENDATITLTIDKLRNDCLQLVNDRCIDTLNLDSLSRIFNLIIQAPEYISFFIDELFVHYELLISEPLQALEDECLNLFSEIEEICNRFNSGNLLASDLDDKILEFQIKLTKWDYYAQPLQVNSRNNGGQHESSENLLLEIRSKVIKICNNAQENLVTLIKQKQFGIGSRNSISRQINAKVPDTLRLIESLISIIDILQSIFAELDIESERLCKDREDLVELKKSLTTINHSVTKEKNGRIAHGVLSIISLIIMIVLFSCGNIGGGVFFLISLCTFGLCFALYPFLKGKMVGIVLVGLIAACIIGALSGESDSQSSSTPTNNNSTSKSSSSSSSSYSSSSSSSSSGTQSGSKIVLSTSNFEDYFTITTSASFTGNTLTINYSIAPKSTAYASKSASATSISVKLKGGVYSTSTSSYPFSSNTSSITLLKSAGYKKEGKITITVSSSYSSVYWNTEITSCSGTIYK